MGNTAYIVKVHFSKDTDNTFKDRVQGLIINERFEKNRNNPHQPFTPLIRRFIIIFETDSYRVEGMKSYSGKDSFYQLNRRISSGRYIKKSAERKPLPIGISDYVRAQSEDYYVDKTMLIKEFLDQKPLVSLFTRPRRFGKTLNMDMLPVFFEISEEDKIFDTRRILDDIF